MIWSCFGLTDRQTDRQSWCGSHRALSLPWDLMKFMLRYFDRKATSCSLVLRRDSSCQSSAAISLNSISIRYRHSWSPDDASLWLSVRHREVFKKHQMFMFPSGWTVTVSGKTRQQCLCTDVYLCSDVQSPLPSSYLLEIYARSFKSVKHVALCKLLWKKTQHVVVCLQEEEQHVRKTQNGLTRCSSLLFFPLMDTRLNRMQLNIWTIPSLFLNNATEIFHLGELERLHESLFGTAGPVYLSSSSKWEKTLVCGPKRRQHIQTATPCV